MCGYCYSMAPKHLNSMCDYTSGPAALAMPACPSPTIIVITVITTTTIIIIQINVAVAIAVATASSVA